MSLIVPRNGEQGSCTETLIVFLCENPFLPSCLFRGAENCSYLPGKTKEEAFALGYEIADTITAMNPAPIKLKFEKVSQVYCHAFTVISNLTYAGIPSMRSHGQEAICWFQI